MSDELPQSIPGYYVYRQGCGPMVTAMFQGPGAAAMAAAGRVLSVSESDPDRLAAEVARLQRDGRLP